MIRFATLNNMISRTIAVSSSGKTFSCTGWKIGWAVGPIDLIKPL
jgi:aspartate/methionine/tyrosine aminotransferase